MLDPRAQYFFPDHVFLFNRSVKNIDELERNIQCKIYINDELADELMTLEEAVQKHDDSYERPRCWFL
jgi:hypothetical protein